jgi:hypothetical protein
VILRTPFEVFVESFVVCEEKKKLLMITTNIGDDDANLFLW